MTENPYDKGGIVPPGRTWVRNDSGEDIPLFTAEGLAARLKWIQDQLRERDEDDDA